MENREASKQRFMKVSEVTSWRKEIDGALEKLALGIHSGGNDLVKATQYVCSSGGKRLRGLLTLAVCSDLETPCMGNVPTRALSTSVALEALHAASLVHDDLPALDNDDMRRGKPSCHKAFGEATAILVGDVLQGAALHAVLADEKLSTDARARIARILAGVWRDLCVGQQLDLSMKTSANSSDRAEMIRLKTGVLFGAAAACGAVCAGAREERVERFFSWGTRVGECFQALDDLIDGDAPQSEKPRVVARCGVVCRELEDVFGLSGDASTSIVSAMILHP